MIDMPAPQSAIINGIRYGWYEAGPRDGLPVVLCHGFPELAFSWRAQIRALAEAGFRVIAPDQRGYGLSEAPTTPLAYAMEHLLADLTGLLDHLHIDKAVWCGHDFGGVVVWQMGEHRPERCIGIISLNTPYQPRRDEEPIAFCRRALGEDNYIVVFQTPGVAERLLEADLDRTFRYFLRRPAKNALSENALPPGRKRIGFIDGLADYDPRQDDRQFLPDSVIAFYVETFRRNGFAGPLGWYRAMTRNWEWAQGQRNRIDLPCLMVTADCDTVLAPSMSKGMERYIGDLSRVMITDCGHWTQQEKPQETNAALIGWLRERFGGVTELYRQN